MRRRMRRRRQEGVDGSQHWSQSYFGVERRKRGSGKKGYVVG